MSYRQSGHGNDRLPGVSACAYALKGQSSGAFSGLILVTLPAWKES